MNCMHLLKDSLTLGLICESYCRQVIPYLILKQF